MQTIAVHAKQAQDAMIQSREAGLKVAHTLAQNYATLVSGVLMGTFRGFATREGKDEEAQGQVATGNGGVAVRRP